MTGSEQRELSSEDGDASFQEKLLALIDERPVPKPTQVVKARSLRFPGEGSSALGKSGPKVRPKGVADGQQVDIPVPLIKLME